MRMGWSWRAGAGRRSWVSLGPAGMLVVGPFLLVGWLMVALVWLFVALVAGVVRVLGWVAAVVAGSVRNNPAVGRCRSEPSITAPTVWP